MAFQTLVVLQGRGPGVPDSPAGFLELEALQEPTGKTAKGPWGWPALPLAGVRVESSKEAADLH